MDTIDFVEQFNVIVVNRANRVLGIFPVGISAVKNCCNCNDCKYMERDLVKFKESDYLYEGNERAGHRMHYGNCTKKGKPVFFIPNVWQLHHSNVLCTVVR